MGTYKSNLKKKKFKLMFFYTCISVLMLYRIHINVCIKWTMIIFRCFTKFNANVCMKSNIIMYCIKIKYFQLYLWFFSLIYVEIEWHL